MTMVCTCTCSHSNFGKLCVGVWQIIFPIKLKQNDRIMYWLKLSPTSIIDKNKQSKEVFKINNKNLLSWQILQINVYYNKKKEENLKWWSTNSTSNYLKKMQRKTLFWSHNTLVSNSKDFVLYYKDRVQVICFLKTYLSW
jgi:hypothetical protein